MNYRLNKFFSLPFIFFAFAFSFSCNAGNPPSSNSDSGEHEKTLCIGFYNVENLFDAVDDTGVDDAEFTPSGKSQWTNEKYHQKISNIAEVIKAINGGHGADILGLSEIENLHVMKDLVHDSQLKNCNYQIVHHDSPDQRGIDVAMIYKKDALKIIAQHYYKVDVSKYEDKPTRDIVMVEGLMGKDTVFIFLNHWPSRRGGTEESEPRREIAATVLRTAVDSIWLNHPSAQFIIMGDFNDNPTDKSISQILKATKTPDVSAVHSLYDPANQFDWKMGEGSEFYRGDWSRFIQIIVSPGLIKNQLDGNGHLSDIHIFDPLWILEEDRTYQQKIPKRTFQEDGSIGFSDHLPVYLMLRN